MTGIRDSLFNAKLKRSRGIEGIIFRSSRHPGCKNQTAGKLYRRGSHRTFASRSFGTWNISYSREGCLLADIRKSTTFSSRRCPKGPRFNNIQQNIHPSYSQWGGNEKVTFMGGITRRRRGNSIYETQPSFAFRSDYRRINRMTQRRM